MTLHKIHAEARSTFLPRAEGMGEGDRERSEAVEGESHRQDSQRAIASRLERADFPFHRIGRR